MTTTTSRLASGTSQERVCVTCDLPLVLAPGSQTYYVHATEQDPPGHTPMPRLAHPMDNDPFGGIPGAYGDEGDEFTPFRSDREADAVAGIIAGLAEIEQSGLLAAATNSTADQVRATLDQLIAPVTPVGSAAPLTKAEFEALVADHKPPFPVSVRRPNAAAVRRRRARRRAARRTRQRQRNR